MAVVEDDRQDEESLVGVHGPKNGGAINNTFQPCHGVIADGRDRRRGSRLVDFNGTICTVIQWDGAIARVDTTCEYNMWARTSAR